MHAARRCPYARATKLVGSSAWPGLTDSPLDPDLVSQLFALLLEQDMATIEHFASLAAALRTSLGADSFDDLRGAIESCDFARAAGLLEPLVCQA